MQKILGKTVLDLPSYDQGSFLLHNPFSMMKENPQFYF